MRAPVYIGGALAIVGLLGQVVALWGNLISAVAFVAVLSPGVLLLGRIALIEWRDPFTPRSSLPIPITTDLGGAISVTEAQAGGEISITHTGELSTVEP